MDSTVVDEAFKHNLNKCRCCFKNLSRPNISLKLHYIFLRLRLAFYQASTVTTTITGSDSD